MASNVATQGATPDTTKGFVMEDMSSYRDGFRNLMRLIIVQAVLMVFLVGFDLWYIATKIPRDSYYAVSPGGTKRPLNDLGMPNTRVDVLSRWTAAAMTQVFTFGFNDIDDRMTQAAPLFSKEGWEGFSNALFRSRMLKKVMNNQQMLSAIPTVAPTVLFEGQVAPGKWGWMMEANLLVQTRAGAQRQTQRYKCRLIIIRLPTAENPMGLGIDSLVVM